jgi:hypothetical protein
MIEFERRIWCGVCGNDIPPGQQYRCLTYQLEREHSEGFIDVEHAETLLRWCGDCVPSKKIMADALLKF